MFEPQRMVLS